MRRLVIFSILLIFCRCAKSWDRFWSMPAIKYSSASYLLFQNETIQSITPSATNSPFTNCIAVPSLPAGLAFEYSTCTINGTPLVTQSAISYTISAFIGANSTNASVILKISNATAVGVYGQLGSFSSNTANNGGISAQSLSSPQTVTTDSTGVYIVDQANNRLLYYLGSQTSAIRVYGQLGSFSSNTANNGGISTNSLASPQGVSVTDAGVYIADLNNIRALFYSATATSASQVYGQLGSFSTNTTNNGGISANSLATSNSIAADSTGVYVADTGNNRVLFFAGTSTTATRVYGQGGSFTSSAANNGGLSASSLAGPNCVAVDSNGLYVSDSTNNRVLFFPGTSTVATRVYGQNGIFTTGVANNGGISAASLSGPDGIALTDTGVYISDWSNNRVLFFRGASTTATRVYGQGGSFTSGTANNGGISATSLNGPGGLTVNSSGVFITDINNNRVLFY